MTRKYVLWSRTTDDALTVCALNKNKLAIGVVARVGLEAVEFLFGTGAHAAAT